MPSPSGYDPTEDDLACGTCEPCRLRLKGFEEAGVPDPILYPKRKEGEAPLGKKAARNRR
jgi:7-cyano-7-deazaguanine synthase in queuosine biosynthesis